MDSTRRLLLPDLEATRAFAHALAAVHVLSVTELDGIGAALEEIAERAEREPAWVGQSQEKDVFAFVDARLAERDAAWPAKLGAHRGSAERRETARRIAQRLAGERTCAAVLELVTALVDLAERSGGAVRSFETSEGARGEAPYAHLLLAGIDALHRALDRLREALDRANECPLGSGDGLGCAVPIDREALAADLGFLRPTRSAADSHLFADGAADGLHAAGCLAQAARVLARIVPRDDSRPLPEEHQRTLAEAREEGAEGNSGARSEDSNLRLLAALTAAARAERPAAAPAGEPGAQGPFDRYRAEGGASPARLSRRLAALRARNPKKNPAPTEPRET